MWASNNEALNEWRWNAGREAKDDAWLLHPNDIWLENPHYRGPKVPHPESDDWGDFREDDDFVEDTSLEDDAWADNDPYA